jgi:hypothetical protein
VTVISDVVVVVSAGGTSGPRGYSVLNGSGAPASTVGINGDMYVDIATYPTAVTFYGPKAAGAWPASGVTMTNGATGPAGGDLTGTYPNPAVAKVNGIAVTGTPQAGQVPTATSTTAATWQTPSGSASAATTVTAETAYSQASGAGAANTYSRGDHTHGSVALTGSAPATTEAIGTAAAVGTATTPARGDHVHPMAAAAAPAASAVTSTQATGVATTFAASDHVHAREGFGAVTAQTTFAAASANGTAATVAHSDHAHGTPTLPTASTSTAGIVQLDGTAGDIAALGTQAAGAVGLAADAGHVHPTTGVGLLAGNQTWGGANTFTAAPAASADPAGGTSLARKSYNDATYLALAGGKLTGNLATSANAFGSPQPINSNVKAWTFDPASAANTATATSQTLFLSAIYPAETFTSTTLYWHVSSVAVTPTAGQNFVGIYNSSGTLLASAGVDSDVLSTGTKATAMAASLTAGSLYWVAFVFVAATAPQMPRPAGVGITGIGTLINVGVTASAARFATNGTTRTSLPTLTPSANTLASGFWAAVA